MDLNEIWEDGRCLKCAKEIKQRGIRIHYWRIHTEEGRNFNPNDGFKKGIRNAWNKGLTKETDARVLKYSEVNSKIKRESRKAAYARNKR